MKIDKKLIFLGVASLGMAVGMILVVGSLMLWLAPRKGLLPVVSAYTPSSNPPNILILIADDAGIDKINIYADDADLGYRDSAATLPQTPTIDSLANAGVRFTDAWANPRCSPTRAALYSGLYGFRTGIGNALGPPGYEDLDPDSVTSLAEMISDEGYASALVGKWHLGEGEVPSGWEEGDDWNNHLDELTTTGLHPRLHGWSSFIGTLSGELNTHGSGGYTDWTMITSYGHQVRATNETTYATEQAIESGLGWVARSKGSSWMLTMSFHAPHTPLEAPASDCTWSGGDDLEEPEEIYRAMVECLDINIASLLSGLDALKELEDTLIFFISDNGTDAGVAEDVFADWRGKGTLYENGVRVPLIVTDGRTWIAQRDGISEDSDWVTSTAIITEPGSEIADLVHVMDIYATIADVTGADGSDGSDSVSLIPFLTDTEGDIREFLYSELFNPQDSTGELSIRTDNWKLIFEVTEGDDGLCRSNYRLYNLTYDRFEQTDLVDSRPMTVERLLDHLDTLATGDAWFEVDDCE